VEIRAVGFTLLPPSPFPSPPRVSPHRLCAEECLRGRLPLAAQTVGHDEFISLMRRTGQCADALRAAAVGTSGGPC